MYLLIVLGYSDSVGVSGQCLCVILDTNESECRPVGFVLFAIAIVKHHVLSRRAFKKILTCRVICFLVYIGQTGVVHPKFWIME